MLLFQSFRLADINIYQGQYLMNNLTLKSFKFCNYSKGTQCHFYLKYHSIIQILYVIKHVFHLKKSGAQLPSTTNDIAVGQVWIGNNCALKRILMMAWELNLQYTILLFEGWTTNEGTGLLPCQRKCGGWRVQGFLPKLTKFSVPWDWNINPYLIKM